MTKYCKYKINIKGIKHLRICSYWKDFRVLTGTPLHPASHHHIVHYFPKSFIPYFIPYIFYTQVLQCESNFGGNDSSVQKQKYFPYK